MPRVPLPLGFGFYESSSKPFAAQRCINWIPVAAESEALSTQMLMQPPGLEFVVDTGLEANRGAHVMDGVPYFVNGDTLVSVDELGVVKTIGIIQGTGQVSMASDGENLVILSPGINARVYSNVADSIQSISDVDWRVSDTVVYKDGYFVFSSSDGKVFFSSGLNNPFAYDALDFGTAESDPDGIVALHVNHNELFVCGSKVIEIFQNVGGSGFPFTRISGANIQKGVHAKFSTVEFDNTFCFVGGGLNERSAVWKVTGTSSAVKISTDTIDEKIQEFTREEISSSFALTWSESGQFFASFTFESERIPPKTLVYNATASAFSGRSVWFELQGDVNDDRFRVQSIVSAYGKLLVGDDRSGMIGEITKDALDYYGTPIFRRMVSSPFNQDGLPVFAGEFEATFESGVGLTLGQGSDPKVRMDFSDDGGRTFSNQTARSLGRKGEYGHRTIWRRQGRFPVSRSIGLTVTDPVRANLIRIAATPEVGSQSG